MCLEKIFAHIVQEVGADLVIVKESKFDLMVEATSANYSFLRDGDTEMEAAANATIQALAAAETTSDSSRLIAETVADAQNTFNCNKSLLKRQKTSAMLSTGLRTLFPSSYSHIV